MQQRYTTYHYTLYTGAHVCMHNQRNLHKLIDGSITTKQIRSNNRGEKRLLIINAS